MYEMLGDIQTTAIHVQNAGPLRNLNPRFVRRVVKISPCVPFSAHTHKLNVVYAMTVFIVILFYYFETYFAQSDTREQQVNSIRGYLAC